MIMTRYKNVILIGFMGCGKTTVGYELAKKLNFTFVDADSAIESEIGMSISQFFAEKGESSFRQLETDYLKKISLKGVAGQVIATGGGMAVSPENQQYMKQLGAVVWLDAKFDLIWQRVKSAKHRPLVQDTKEAKMQLENIYQSRVSAYTEAYDFKIELDKLSLDEIILGVIESIRYAETP